jgi:heme-degrading monooxygenase HmoA
MLLRIVKMEFDLAHVQAFDDLFAQSQARIKEMPGCHGVRIIKGLGDQPIRTTLSWWEHDADLQAYRKSSLFGEVWPRTKAMFSAPPVAWSSDWPADEPIPGVAE